MSIFMASMLRTVSRNDSPFETLDVLFANVTTSALIRFSASSNDIRVLVESSKKRLSTAIPLSVGTMRIGLSRTSLKESAVSRMAAISSRETPFRPNRCLSPSAISRFLLPRA